jgi:hypothetical protein
MAVKRQPHRRCEAGSAVRKGCEKLASRKNPYPVEVSQVIALPQCFC